MQQQTILHCGQSVHKTANPLNYFGYIMQYRLCPVQAMSWLITGHFLFAGLYVITWKGPCLNKKKTKRTFNFFT